jgi:hypothetical protein
MSGGSMQGKLLHENTSCPLLTSGLNTMKNVKKDSDKGHRADFELLDKSIDFLCLGIFRYLLKKKYAPVYGEKMAKFWAAAVLNTILLQPPSNNEAQDFYRKNQEKILQDAVNINKDEELATATSYLYAAKTISLAATTKNIYSERSQELGQQATRLGIYIPNTYDICGTDNMGDCIKSIDSFAKAFLNKNSKGQT